MWNFPRNTTKLLNLKRMAAFAEKCKFNFQIQKLFIWQHFRSKPIFFLDSLVYFLQKSSISIFPTSHVYELWEKEKRDFENKMRDFAINVNLVFEFKNNLSGNTSGQNLYFSWIPWFISFKIHLSLFSGYLTSINCK